MFTVRPLGRLLAAGFASLLLAGTAAAGPIPWEFSSAFRQRGLNPLWGQLQPSGGGSNNGIVGVETAATVGYLNRTPLNQPAMWGPQQFFLDVTITDTISGDSGTLTFDGSGFEGQIPGFPATRFTFITGLDSEPTQSLRFGDRIYHVDLRTRQQGIGMTVVDAMVTIETPEPASLAMAGLGLASVAGLRLRRRRTSACA